MPRKKKTQRDLTKNQVIAWDMYSKGMRQVTIAKEMGITETGVSVLLNAAHARYSKFLDIDVKRYYEKHLAQLEYIAEEALTSWRNDLKIGKNGVQHDPAYLETAMRSIEGIRKVIYNKKQDDYREAAADDKQDPLERIMALVNGARARGDYPSS